MAKILGIDLGTTNSCMAVIEGGEPRVIENSEGARTTPSVVGLNTRNGERYEGQTAKRQAVTNPRNTVFSVKRFMGRRFVDDSVNRDVTLVPFEVSEHTNGDVYVTMGGKKYAPPEISAMVLQKLKRDAEDKLGEPINQAVITVPAYFKRQPAQRNQGRRPHRRPGGAAHHQRAHRGGARLRTGQEGRRDHRPLRPGRRHVRHYHSPHRRRRVRGGRHKRRHPPWRRRLRPAHHRLGLRGVSPRGGSGPATGTAPPCSASGRPQNAPRSSCRRS